MSVEKTMKIFIVILRRIIGRKNLEKGQAKKKNQKINMKKIRKGNDNKKEQTSLYRRLHVQGRTKMQIYNVNKYNFLFLNRKQIVVFKALHHSK